MANKLCDMLSRPGRGVSVWESPENCLMTDDDDRLYFFKSQLKMMAFMVCFLERKEK